MITREHIFNAPKADLHLHLDGSLRLETLVELARERGVELPSYSPEGLREWVFKKTYADLPDYLRGFAHTCAVLRDTEAVERVACELGEDCIAENTRYAEVRFAPQLLVENGADAAGMLCAAARGLERAARAHNATAAVRTGADMPFAFGVICCAMRSFGPGMGAYYGHLSRSLAGLKPSRVYAAASLVAVEAALEARDRHGAPVVGFDLAGEEAGFRAGHHAEAFQRAHAGFLRKTVHAGEAYGPESIYEAVTACLAERVGHGTSLLSPGHVRDASIADPALYVRRLAEYIAARRVTVEVCPTSNLQTMPSLRGDLRNHPLREMLARHISVAVGTDNTLVSRTTLTDEVFLAARACGLDAEATARLMLGAFKAAFFPGSHVEKRAFTALAAERVGRALGIGGRV
ncbi:MAG: adenosine deaminase family protein [Kiritimatiellaeota bacterium]|nr:adenosine deaminase family protein [Kiritimatiellota bacterium]